MKIKVDADGYRFTIPFPNGIIFNRITTHIVASCLKKYLDFPLMAKQLNGLCYELKQAKKTFGKLVLVDVQSNDGKKIKITL